MIPRVVLTIQLERMSSAGSALDDFLREVAEIGCVYNNIIQTPWTAQTSFETQYSNSLP